MPLLLLFLLWGITLSAVAQDEDLSALETAIATEPESLAEPLPRRTRPGTATPNEATSARNLDLRSVIEEGFRRNPFEQIRDQQREQIDLLKTDLWQGFWLPNISLSLTSSNHQIDRLRESTRNVRGMGGENAPSGALQLGVADYTIFNWGRDYLAYQNSRDTLDRTKVSLVEQKRRLKFQLIGQYFNLIRVKEILRIKQEQLRQASFVHRFAREKLQLRKVRAQEYYQTRSEYLRAQSEYQEALFDVGEEERNMAVVLGDDYRGAYRSAEQLKFVSVNVGMEDALRYAQEQSVDYRSAKLNYDTASRSYDKALKDNLPLPRFHVGLGTYAQNFTDQDSSWAYSTGTDANGNVNRNIEVQATINVTWTLLGEGGFFNGRVNKLAYLNKRISEISFFQTRRELELKVRTIFKNLRFLEQKVEIAKFQHKNAQSNYDSALDNYMAGRATFSDYKLAIDNLVLSHVNSQNVIYEHLLKKLELSDFMGLEDLPGDTFETLAVR